MVRHADAASDAEACRAIYAPHVVDGAVSFEHEPPSATAFAERIERTSLTHPWLVAERYGAIAGFAYASPHRARPGYRWATDVAVYVDAAWRRAGIGRQLYAALLPLLSRQGLHVACAGITLPNAASVGLHEALDFAPVGVYRGIGYKAGAWHDVGWWQLRLTDAEGAPTEPLPPQRLDDALISPTPGSVGPRQPERVLGDMVEDHLLADRSNPQ
jgi:phosphinothricin acetyltransferase